MERACFQKITAALRTKEGELREEVNGLRETLAAREKELQAAREALRALGREDKRNGRKKPSVGRDEVFQALRKVLENQDRGLPEAELKAKVRQELKQAIGAYNTLEFRWQFASRWFATSGANDTHTYASAQPCHILTDAAGANNACCLALQQERVIGGMSKS